MEKLLLATTNKGKLREIQPLLSELNVDLVTPDGIGLNLEVEESGASYSENAAIKAKAFAKASNLISLADDSGLEVEALNGQPGIHSARFSPKPGATDADRRVYLLEKLQAFPRPWKALFRCIVCIATPPGVTYFTEGVCRGEIIPEERGDQGFGYDPIFLLPNLDKTMAELKLEEKNRISHRARAVNSARPILVKLLCS